MMTIDEVIKIHFYECMYYSNYNKSLCARVMGVTVKTVHNYCYRFGIDKSYVLVRQFSDCISPELNKNGNETTTNVSEEIKPHESIYDTINWDKIKYFATNEERLTHADSMINRNHL